MLVGSRIMLLKEQWLDVVECEPFGLNASVLVPVVGRANDAVPGRDQVLKACDAVVVVVGIAVASDGRPAG